jgi:hypothetical protein
MRALPADSVEYFGDTADGKTASVAGGRVAAVGAVVAGGAAGAPAAGALVGSAAAPLPHSAFRKSFHFIPFSVPDSCAALYLALHSFIVRACAPETGAISNNAPRVVAQRADERTSMIPSLVLGRITNH